MKIRKAAASDAKAIMEIYTHAQQSIKLLGIDQWQNGYPNPEVIREDLSADRLYVCTDEEKIIGAFALITDREPTYDKIYNGSWLSDSLYIAVHRIAVDTCIRRRGTASFMMDFVKAEASVLNRKSVRIDTHRGNLPMRGMLEHNGFVYCGTIFLDDGQERVAYEYVFTA